MKANAQKSFTSGERFDAAYCKYYTKNRETNVQQAGLIFVFTDKKLPLSVTKTLKYIWEWTVFFKNASLNEILIKESFYTNLTDHYKMI